MAGGRSHGPPDRHNRRDLPSEAGLRALGDQAGPGSRQPGAVANEQGLRELGDRIERVSRRSRGTARPERGDEAEDRPPTPGRRRWSRRRKLVTSLVVLVLLLVGGGIGGWAYLEYRYSKFTKLSIPADVPEVSGQPFNMLVIGSDSRVGLSAAEQAAIGTAQQVAGQRSDVVEIWHVDPSTNQITVLSIPRDTLVSIIGAQVDDFGTFNRINSTFNSGPNDLVSTIEDNFGIPINRVIEVGFGGLEGAVNALGGIHLDFHYPAMDNYSGLDVTSTGCQLLDGTQALALARSRHYQYQENGVWQYDGTSDFGRIQRQGAFLRALISAARSDFNPLQLNQFLSALPAGIAIDSRFSVGQLVGLAEHFHSFSPQALDTLTLPTESLGDVSPWGDVLFVDQPAAQQMLVSVFGSELDSPPNPPPNTYLESVPPPEVTPTTTTVPTTTSGSGSAESGPTTTTTTVPPFDPTAC